MDEKTVKKLIQQGITDYMMNSQYSVTQIPSHVHNGVDSQQVSYNSLTDVADTVTYTLFGTNAATSSNYSIFFVAPYQLKLMSAREVHATNGTDGGAVSLQIERLTGTTAPGSGVLLLTTAFDLKGTINTVQTGTVVTPFTGTTGTVLATGDRLALKLTGTPTSVANVTVTLVLGL